MGLPFLSLTVTVSTTSCVVDVNFGMCGASAARTAAEPQHTGCTGRDMHIAMRLSHRQNLTRKLTCMLRIVFADVGSPNCELCDNRVPRNEADVIERVLRVDPQIGVHPVAHPEGARQRRVRA